MASAGGRSPLAYQGHNLFGQYVFCIGAVITFDDESGMVWAPTALASVMAQTMSASERQMRVVMRYPVRSLKNIDARMAAFASGRNDSAISLGLALRPTSLAGTDAGSIKSIAMHSVYHLYRGCQAQYN